MTVKELNAKVDTIDKLSANNEIKAICEVVGELIKNLEEKKIGFKAEK